MVSATKILLIGDSASEDNICASYTEYFVLFPRLAYSEEDDNTSFLKAMFVCWGVKDMADAFSINFNAWSVISNAHRRLNPARGRFHEYESPTDLIGAENWSWIMWDRLFTGFDRNVTDLILEGWKAMAVVNWTACVHRILSIVTAYKTNGLRFAGGWCSGTGQRASNGRV